MFSMEAVRKAARKKRKEVLDMLNCKKLIALSMSAALALSLCACSKTAPVSPAPSAQEAQNAENIGSENVQIPNPWADCDTAADAAALAALMKEHCFAPIIAHAPYTLNLCGCAGRL